MNSEHNIQEKLNRELHKLQENDLAVVPLPVIKEIISIFKSLDSDMKPMHDLILYSCENMENESVRTVIFYRLLKYYGLVGKPDILSTRQRFVLLKDSKKLVKKPFLKNKDKDCINIILKDMKII